MAPYICVVADVRVRLRAPSFVAVHLGALRIGACMAETNWSVRGWMQDKKFNTRSLKLKLKLVDAHVRLHSNILFEPRMDFFEAFAVPWDVDCSIQEEPGAGRRRSRRLSGEAPDETIPEPEGEPERVFRSLAEEDEDPFGDPEADLEISGSGNDE